MIEIDTITEDLDLRKKGMKYVMPSVGTFYLRRAGLSDWQMAIKEATEDVLGREYSFNEIDPRTNEEITALACVNYLVAGWDDLNAVDQGDLPYSLTNAKNLLLPEANYKLVELLVTVASRAENFLLSVSRIEAEQLKKSLSGS